MRPVCCRFLSTALSAPLLAISVVVPALAQSRPPGQQPDLSGFYPTALEVTMLPRYCWGQFNPQFRGTGMEAFNLPPRSVCGERMNHFCPALVSLNRAKNDARGQRGYWLGVAHGHMKYTLNALSEVPLCPLASEIERYAAEINGLRAASGR